MTDHSGVWHNKHNVHPSNSLVTVTVQLGQFTLR